MLLLLVTLILIVLITLLDGELNSDSLCMQFSLYQSISQPTHFTEHSSSLIDIILVSNKENLILSGVADPFLNQDVRFHCPVYGVLKFSKPKSKAFVSHICSFENGNYELL